MKTSWSELNAPMQKSKEVTEQQSGSKSSKQNTQECGRPYQQKAEKFTLGLCSVHHSKNKDMDIGRSGTSSSPVLYCCVPSDKPSFMEVVQIKKMLQNQILAECAAYSISEMFHDLWKNLMLQKKPDGIVITRKSKGTCSLYLRDTSQEIKYFCEKLKIGSGLGQTLFALLRIIA